MKSLAAALGSLVLLSAGPSQEPRVVTVPIVGELTPAHTALVRRAAREIRSRPPALVIFEIDTPGGRGDVMLAMGEEIMNLAPVATAAYVRPQGSGGGAWSAGAYLALSCKKIFMHPGTVIGAAAPVSSTGEEIPEKHVSAFREKFRARAEQNGYSGNLAVAMVDKDLELFEVEIDGKKLFLTVTEMDRLQAQGKKFDRPASPFDQKGKLLTLTDRQVEEVGLGRVAEGRPEIYRAIGLSRVVEEAIVPSWSEKIVEFLTSGMISTALLAIGVLGIWIEIKTPGFGIPGIVGIVAFALFFFGSHLAGLAEVPEILLFVLGLALIAVEIFLLPGTGVFAVAGALCVLAALVLSLQGFAWPDPKNAPWEVDLLLSSVGRVLVAFVISGTGLVVFLRFLPRVPILGRLVLQTQLTGAAGPAPAAVSTLVGRQGHAVTPLHPGGKIQVGDDTLDVVSEGEFVARGEPVEVVRVEGARIVVARLKR